MPRVLPCACPRSPRVAGQEQPGNEASRTAGPPHAASLRGGLLLREVPGLETRGDALIDHLRDLWSDDRPWSAVGFAALILGLEFGLSITRWGPRLVWILGVLLTALSIAEFKFETLQAVLGAESP